MLLLPNKFYFVRRKKRPVSRTGSFHRLEESAIIHPSIHPSDTPAPIPLLREHNVRLTQRFSGSPKREEEEEEEGEEEPLTVSGKKKEI